MAREDENFRLKVESIVYDVLKKEDLTKIDVRNLVDSILKAKELTANEVDAMKKAIKDTIDVIITKHQHEMMSRIHKTLGLVLTVFALILMVLQLLIKIYT
jgi:hypothetical protein